MRSMFLLSLVLLTGCVTAADQPAPTGLAERFEAVVFNDDGDGNSATRDGEPILLRWDRPMTVGLVTDDAETFRPYADYADTVLENLSNLSGLPYSFRPDGDIRIVWSDARSIRNIFNGMPPDKQPMNASDCGATRYGNPDLVLITIRNDLPPEITRNCIVQELTQSLGLMNDIADPEGTVFSSRSLRDTLSLSDRRLVRILYDPRLKSGMTREQAMPIVRQIIAERGW